MAGAIPKRVATIDLARGLLAFGVMLYHCLHYTGIVTIPQIGTFGVYCFFAISGFSLYIVYRDRLISDAAVRTYFVRRFLRIAPLYYAAMAIGAAAYGLENFSHLRVGLNATFLFGWTNPGETALVTGGWSIGIETVFYAIFPIVILAAGGNLLRLTLLTAVVLSAQFLYVNEVLATGTVVTEWVRYTQPIAFGGYFVAGCLVGEIYMRRPSWKGSAVAWVAAAVVLLPIALSPLDYGIVSGAQGVVLALCGIGLMAAVAFLPEPRGLMKAAALSLGRLSYPVYLLHTIVFDKLWAGIDSAAVLIPLTIVVTMVVSELVSRVIEEPARRYGRALQSATP